ncbi:flagellar filament capping protein FliD [Alteromonas lipolytica]|uniref:Flagellar hook-associated protein 2 n=1 Tax=Alteromonas lipolytica TaxID=1856405 RepID=A0A1E8FGI7_9ALTE|nr:flagellar filament capping protein FliD [Alteromonas lipolytica]OFI34573.1 flagellar hook protein [Alteromonas lipolytica]GGF52183.1 flagellar hook-associated protein 2 [Alteromonas lipolytica]
MTIQSLGVGSGLALDDLVTQLLNAEREPKEARLNDKEERIEAEISALGQIKSKLSDFKDTVDEMRRDSDINGREPTITHPSEDKEIFTADAANSALRGTYEIAVSDLASGSRIETDNGAFNSSADKVLTDGLGKATMTFKINNTGDSFSVEVTQDMSLAELREKINNNSDNFGVNANIIDTGTAIGGAKLVFTSDVTGTGNNLVIVNDGNRTELDKLTTTNSTETITNLSPVKNASNAKATIDGIPVESATNEFENTIQNVSFEVSSVSPLDTDGVTRKTSTLEIGYDRKGLETKIRDFVDNYNKIIADIKSLTRYGESDLEEDGALAGDSLLRGISNSLASVVGSSVDNSSLGSLFALGVELNSDGELEIPATDFGLGSGTERLEAALEDNFDEIAKLFTDENQGIAVRLFELTKEYTSYSGLISLRERAAKDDKDQIADERERFDLRMLNYEQILRDRYLNLDQTVARLNQTGSALLAALG